MANEEKTNEGQGSDDSSETAKHKAQLLDELELISAEIERRTARRNALTVEMELCADEIARIRNEGQGLRIDIAKLNAQEQQLSVAKKKLKEASAKRAEAEQDLKRAVERRELVSRDIEEFE